MKPLRVVMLVLGSILALVGVGLLIGGALLGGALATQRDDDGFFTTRTHPFASDTYAITSDRIDLGEPGPDSWWADRDLATVRVVADSTGAAALFVGIGPEDEVEAYLADVPHDEVIDLDDRPFRVEYSRQNGTASGTPASPAGQDFWVATGTGAATQTLTWDLEPGEWAVVVMNADGSRQVGADIEFAGKVSYLVQVAIVLAVLGALILAAGAALIVAGAHGAHAATEPASLLPVTAAGSPPASPVQLTGRLDEGLNRWKWLVKWFLAIPHFIVLVVLWIAFVVLTVVAFFAIVFTGRYPRRLFAFNVGVLRWSWRVGFYATSAIGTDRYPPFTLGPADYPATLDIAYPERLSRGRVWVKSWLLAIPHLVIVGLMTSSPAWGEADRGGGIGLLGFLVIVAGVALLFTRRYPQGLFDLVMGLNRWVYRVIAYVALMTDEYPPFRLDQGPTEPGVGDAGGRPIASLS